MGLLTLDQMKNEVTANLGGRTDLDSYLNNRLNLQCRRIAGLHDWEELQRIKVDANSATDTKSYDAATFLGESSNENIRDIHTLRLIDGTNSRKLTRITVTRLDEVMANPENSSSGRPNYYVWYGNYLEMIKIPNAIYTFYARYSLYPETMANGASTSDLKNKDDAIIALTTSWNFSSLKMREEAAHWFTIAKNLLLSAIKEDQTDRDLKLTPTSELSAPTGDYWNDPFQKEAP